MSDIIKENAGIRLDIGCGQNKVKGFVGLDIFPHPGVGIVHDVNIHPWPLPDECVVQAISSHLVEHIPPVAFRADGSTRFPFIEFMDEVWRILKPSAQFAINCPHANSSGFAQDPTHCNMINEATWAYFAPDQANGLLYNFYKPKPWSIELISWDPSMNMEVVLRKIDEPIVEELLQTE